MILLQIILGIIGLYLLSWVLMILIVSSTLLYGEAKNRILDYAERLAG